MEIKINWYPVNNVIRNPITHEIKGYGNGDINGEIESSFYAQQQQQCRQTQRFSKTPYRSTRNPITGEGLDDEDCFDLLRLPNEYCFRRRVLSPTSTTTTHTTATTAKTEKTSPVRKVDKITKPTAVPKSASAAASKSASTAASKSATAPAPATTSAKTKPSENQTPVVKKVIRPKRPTASEQDNAPKPNPDSTAEQIKTVMDGGESGTINHPIEQSQVIPKPDFIEPSDTVVKPIATNAVVEEKPTETIPTSLEDVAA